MKRTILIGAVMLITSLSTAQTPQAIPYQATTLNAAGQPLANHPIAVRFSILDSIISGDVLYKELHTISTNALGLFTANIGQGTPVSGTFNTINWAVNNKFLKVELDTTGGGTTFTDLGTQQLLSVPYALHAKTAESVTGLSQRYIGEYYGGGIIFHLWKDSLGVEQGLVVDLNDLGVDIEWTNVYDTENPFANIVGAQSDWDGLTNSTLITSQPGHILSAASLCLNSNAGGFSDWYLPAYGEISLILMNRLSINRALRSISVASELSPTAPYWSSTEYESTIEPQQAYYRDLNKSEGGGPRPVWQGANVRAIRAF